MKPKLFRGTNFDPRKVATQLPSAIVGLGIGLAGLTGLGIGLTGLSLGLAGGGDDPGQPECLLVPGV